MLPSDSAVLKVAVSLEGLPEALELLRTDIKSILCCLHTRRRVCSCTMQCVQAVWLVSCWAILPSIDIRCYSHSDRSKAIDDVQRSLVC